MNAGKPFNGSHAHAFNQHGDNLDGLVQVNPQIVQRALGNIRERAPAVTATVTLEAFMEAEFLAFTFAVVTRHFGLVFLVGQGYRDSES